jgi:membrane-bound serine protease (ClpP class)
MILMAVTVDGQGMMDIALTFWNLLINPNVTYLLLVIGLWALIAAIAAPGIGIPEAATVICLTLAVVGLVRLPVNIVGVSLIIVSMVMLAIDLKVQSHGALTVGGVVTMALGSIFLFRPVEGQPGLSLWVVGITVLGSALFFGVALAAAVSAQQRPPVMAPRAIIGQLGEARDPLAPTGVVQLHSELWSAKVETPGEVIESGAKVIVTGVEGFTLRVKRVSEESNG